MIVAAGTAERQAEERSARRVELLVDDVHPHFRLVRFGKDFRADAEKAGRDELLVSLIFAAKRQKVAGKLLCEEPIERLVLIERRDHVITIPPGVPMADVFVEPV